MQGRFAFTAKYWGDAAVVCRATEHRPGPSVQQEFGKFATWTQANAFATQLNECLEIAPGAAALASTRTACSERPATRFLMECTSAVVQNSRPMNLRLLQSDWRSCTRSWK